MNKKPLKDLLSSKIERPAGIESVSGKSCKILEHCEFTKENPSKKNSFSFNAISFTDRLVYHAELRISSRYKLSFGDIRDF